MVLAVLEAADQHKYNCLLNRAKEEYLRRIVDCELGGDQRAVCVAKSLLGECFSMNNQSQLAKRALGLALALAQELEDKSLIGGILRLRAEHYMRYRSLEWAFYDIEASSQVLCDASGIERALTDLAWVRFEIFRGWKLERLQPAEEGLRQDLQAGWYPLTEYHLLLALWHSDRNQWEAAYDELTLAARLLDEWAAPDEYRWRRVEVGLFQLQCLSQQVGFCCATNQQRYDGAAEALSAFPLHVRKELQYRCSVRRTAVLLGR